MVIKRPRANVRARSPSSRMSLAFQHRNGQQERLTILSQELLEIVQVEVLVFGAPCDWHEKADEEHNHDQDDESDGVLEGTPKARPHGLRAIFFGTLIVLFVEEVSEGNEQKTQHSIQRVQGIVNNLQSVNNVVHLVGRGPVLAAAFLGGVGGRGEGNVDGHEQNSGPESAHGEDAYCGHGGGAFARGLVDVDEDGGDGQQNDNSDGIGDPDQACLDERHCGEIASAGDAVELEILESQVKPSREVARTLGCGIRAAGAMGSLPGDGSCLTMTWGRAPRRSRCSLQRVLGASAFRLATTTTTNKPRPLPGAPCSRLSCAPSAATMQVYTELTPPTAVSNAVSLAFLGPKAHNLVVAKTSLLQVFELKSIVTEVSQAAKDGPATAVAADDPSEPADLFVQRTEHTSKLVLVAEYPLQGTVLSLARIKALDTKSGGDALLIAFRDAKMSLVEWDPVNHALSTISIHFYEGEELQGAPWDADLGQYHNFLVADPSSRCAALKFGARHLAILPFRQLGDDLVEGDDYDPDLDEPPAAKEKATNGDVPQTPYKSSFALSLPQIDPTLTHPVHLDFLHEYREPTFGIISANKAAAASLLYERRDVLTYTVFTLDLEEKASTALLSVTGLPYDTSKVMPLPLPVGGALLLGANQFIHVDQAGKTNAVAVNDFAKQCSSFPMADQSDLGMRLEGASVELLSSETGDLIVVLRDGSLAIIDFKLDGRSVSGISIRRVSEDKGGSVVVTAASCTTSLGRNRMFIGSEDGDSVVLGWTKKATQLSRKRTHAEMLADDAELSFDEEDLEDDDDLYGDGPSTAKAAAASSDSSDPGNYTFRIHDSLPSLAPIKDMALASHKVTDTAMGVVEKTIDQLDLVASTGRGKAGALAVMRRELDPVIMRKGEFSTARAVWSVHAKKPAPKGMVAAGPQDAEAKLAADVDYDQFLIVLRSNSEGGEESAVFNITATGFEETSKGDFEREDAATINVGTIAGGTRIVQVLKAEIRSYDSGKCKFLFSFSVAARRLDLNVHSGGITTKMKLKATLAYGGSARRQSCGVFAGQSSILHAARTVARAFVWKLERTDRTAKASTNHVLRSIQCFHLTLLTALELVHKAMFAIKCNLPEHD